MALVACVGEAAALHPGRELLPVRVQDLLLLLAHGPAQQVGAAQGVPGQLLGDGHDLLLVDDQVVGLAQDRLERLLQLGVDGLDLLPAVLAVGVVDVGVGRHRARPVQGQHGRDVAERRGRHQLEQAAHRAAVELEHAEGVAAGQQVVGRLVLQRQLGQVDLDAPVGDDVLDRVREHGEVAQPEEVHLQQAHVLALHEREAGDDGPVVLAAVDGQHVGQRLRRQDHPGGVHAGAAGQALDAARGVQDPLDLGVFLVQGAQLAGLAVPVVGRVEDARQRDLLAHDRGREQLGDPVADRVRVAQHPAGVLDRRLGLDGAEGEDLADPVVAVLLGDVPDHVAPAAFVEVQVDVRHGDALGVQEPLEDQRVLDRVQVGDAQHVGHHRAGGRAAARAKPDLAGPRVAGRCRPRPGSRPGSPSSR